MLLKESKIRKMIELTEIEYTNKNTKLKILANIT